MRIHWRSAAGMLATAALLSLFCLLPSGAQEAPGRPATPPPAAPPAASPATPPATPPREKDPVPEPEERGGEELPADERVSADNNLSFPVDI